MAESCFLCPYRGSCIFGGQSQKVVGDFSASLRRLSFQGKGKIVFRQGDLFRGYYFLCEGSVKIVKVLKTGDQIILDVLEPCSFLSLIPEQKGSRHKCTAVTAAKSSEVAYISEAQLSSLVKRYPPLGFAIARYFSGRLRATGRLLASMKLSVQERLLVYISGKLAPGKSKTGRIVIELSFSHRDLAEIIQTTPESLSRTFRQLQEEGVLKVRKGAIEILQPDLLIDYFNDNQQ